MARVYVEIEGSRYYWSGNFWTCYKWQAIHYTAAAAAEIAAELSAEVEPLQPEPDTSYVGEGI